MFIWSFIWLFGVWYFGIWCFIWCFCIWLLFIVYPPNTSSSHQSDLSNFRFRFSGKGKNLNFFLCFCFILKWLIFELKHLIILLHEPELYNSPSQKERMMTWTFSIYALEPVIIFQSKCRLAANTASSANHCLRIFTISGRFSLISLQIVSLAQLNILMCQCWDMQIFKY